MDNMQFFGIKNNNNNKLTNKHTFAALCVVKKPSHNNLQIAAENSNRSQYNNYGMSNVAIFDLSYLYCIISYLYCIISYAYCIKPHFILYNFLFILYIFLFVLYNFHLYCIISYLYCKTFIYIV